ncbi:MAG: energy transducer TonB [Myxococcales bacterium]|nr:energy transducer TonB [Myxococcales bacterium]
MWIVVSIAAHAVLAGLLLSVDRRLPRPKNRVSTMTQRKIELPPPPKKKKLPPPPPEKKAPPPEKKAPPPKKIARRIKRVRRVSKPPPKVAPPPSGKPEGKSPPDTGRKTFGIKFEGKTTAPTGQGVQVRKGDSVDVNPRVTKRGPPAKGFKKRYKAGEQAPLAVITTKPLPSKRVMPKYPERARDLGIEGRVVLELTIDGKGNVIKARVIRKLHPDLDAAAITAAKQMKFKPATVNGTPVTVKISYSFAFVLD